MLLMGCFYRLIFHDLISFSEIGKMLFLCPSSDAYAHGYCQDEYDGNQNARFHMLSFHLLLQF